MVGFGRGPLSLPAPLFPSLFRRFSSAAARTTPPTSPWKGMELQRRGFGTLFGGESERFGAAAGGGGAADAGGGGDGAAAGGGGGGAREGGRRTGSPPAD
uniref:Uncharacterized protein n=1 Tax=Setaria viridis TaxID=4556 RepID=A0A4U6VCX6_SETVI|nr:hypothetical protein SEVIR_3G136150v2 [Setaria viridis]